MGLKWKQELVTGIEEIDSQHAELFNNIDNLITTCNEGKGKEQVTSVIEFVESYIETHLKTEEKFMADNNYVDYDIHKAEHEKFIKQFNTIKSALNEDGATNFLALQVNQNIVNWLITHVARADKELGNFLSCKK